MLALPTSEIVGATGIPLESGIPPVTDGFVNVRETAPLAPAFATMPEPALAMVIVVVPGSVVDRLLVVKRNVHAVPTALEGTVSVAIADVAFEIVPHAPLSPLGEYDHAYVSGLPVELEESRLMVPVSGAPENDTATVPLGEATAFTIVSVTVMVRSSTSVSTPLLAVNRTT